MWFRRKPEPPPSVIFLAPPPAETPAAPVQEAALDLVLDTLAAVVRLLGRHAFDTPNCSASAFEAQCERWSRHLLVGAEHPTAAEQTPPSGPVPLDKRDWKGLYRFLQQQRLAEEQAVQNSVSALRNLIIDSLSRFRLLLEEDQKLDQAIQHQIECLEHITQDQPLEVVHQHIVTTVQSISALLRDKNRAIDRQLEQLRIQIRSAREEILDMRREMEEDPLTGTHNRRALDKTLAKLTDYAAFVSEELTLMLVDVDNLKTVNDVYGHQAGDTLLRAVGETLIKAFPRKDDFIARYGGDEFAVILSQTDRNTAMRLADRCLQLFRALEIPWNEHKLTCTVSIGIACHHRDESIESCLSRADEALYRVKQGGRNGYACA